MPISVCDAWSVYSTKADCKLTTVPSVTESQVIVNLIHMLMGLETDYFVTHGTGDGVTVVVSSGPRNRNVCPLVSPLALRNVLKQFAKYGSVVWTVRQSVRAKQMTGGVTDAWYVETGSHLLRDFDIWLNTELEEIPNGFYSLIGFNSSVRKNVYALLRLHTFSSFLHPLDPAWITSWMEEMSIIKSDRRPPDRDLLTRWLTAVGTSVVSAIAGTATDIERNELMAITDRVREWHATRQLLVELEGVRMTPQFRRLVLAEPILVDEGPFTYWPYLCKTIHTVTAKYSLVVLDRFRASTHFDDFSHLVNEVMFFAQSDFVSTFLSIAGGELSKDRSKVRLYVLAEAFETATDTCPCLSSYPPERWDAFSLNLSDSGHTGWEGMRFRLSLPNLFGNSELLKKINLIHKFTFTLTRLDWELANVYREYKSSGFRELLAVRAAMGVFVHRLRAEVYAGLIQSGWRTFDSRPVQSVTELNEAYATYIDGVESGVRKMQDSRGPAIKLVLKFVNAVLDGPLTVTSAVGFLNLLSDLTGGAV